MRRWSVVAIFFAFMLLHQADKLLIGPLTTPIMATFGLDEAQMGAVFTGALIVGAVLYPLWGYLYDRFARPRLLALAAFIWGATTWLSALAPTFPIFLATRASTGIDDSTYPGLFSLVADHFGPHLRGKVYGLLQLTSPLGYLAGMLLALTLRDVIGWRGVFYITGSLGVLLAVVIALGVRDAPRGRTEPELAGLEQIGVYRFEWAATRRLLRTPSLRLLFVQGFFGSFPWNIIAAWFFHYLETERGYSSDAVLSTMLVAVLVLAAGYFVGGSLGDFFFRRNPRGRLLVAITGTLAGSGLLFASLNVPAADQSQFMVLLSLTALFIPFASPNVVATVYDITPPEVRSTAVAMQSFIEEGGAAVAPLVAGLIAVRSSLHVAILALCLAAWLLCAAFFALAAHRLPRDIDALRRQMSERAERERARQPAVPALEPGD